MLLDLQGDQQATGAMTFLKTGPGALSIRGRTLENGLAPLELNKK
jgi:hypothetical protein